MKNKNTIIVRKSDIHAILAARVAIEKAEVAKARIREALPVGTIYTLDGYTVAHNKGMAASETLDVARLRKAEPELYAALMEKYGKTTAARQGAIVVRETIN